MPRLICPRAAALAVGFFLVLTRTHERHLYPALPLLALTCAVCRRYWPVYALVLFTSPDASAAVIKLSSIGHGSVTSPS